jgi:ubiquinone/menaquinone biosynthesis C-methylase UbiE
MDYDQMAREYARHRNAHPELLINLAEQAPWGPETCVVEVGCGSGNYILSLAEITGWTCWGVEPSSGMLNQAAPGIGNVQFRQGSADALDFEAGFFDLVYSVDMIHHLPDPGPFVREAFRVLKPGGRWVAATDSEWIIRNRKPLAEYFPQTIERDLARYHSLEHLAVTLESTGFKGFDSTMVEQAYPIDDIGPYRDKAFSVLHLIDEEHLRAGLARMERDLLSGPLDGVARYAVVSGLKPEV